MQLCSRCCLKCSDLVSQLIEMVIAKVCQVYALPQQWRIQRPSCSPWTMALPPAYIHEHAQNSWVLVGKHCCIRASITTSGLSYLSQGRSGRGNTSLFECCRIIRWRKPLMLPKQSEAVGQVFLKHTIHVQQHKSWLMSHAFELTRLMMHVFAIVDVSIPVMCWSCIFRFCRNVSDIPIQ